ncbi:hypothetical protein ACFLWA_02740 [Chloroflexota bacterium]
MPKDPTEPTTSENEVPIMTQDETQPDVEQLQAEVTELQRRLAEKEPPRHTGRKVAVALLVLTGCILLAVANMAFWLRGTALNTNRWVAAVGPLSQNEVIAGAVSDLVVQELSAAVDLDAAASEILPPEFSGFSGPLARVLKDLVADAVSTIVQSDEFNEVWRAANRTAHRILVDILRGRGSLVYVQDGQITVDLSDMFGFVQGTLGLGELDLFGEADAGKFVLFSSEDLASLQRAVALLDTVGLALPLLAIVALVIAWLVSLWRRRTLLWIGLGVAITMVLSLVVYFLAQPIALAAVLDPYFRAIAGELWNTVVRGLYIQSIFLLVVGLLIALGAWLAGPTNRAVSTRSTVQGWWASLRGKDTAEEQV